MLRSSASFKSHRYAISLTEGKFVKVTNRLYCQGTATRTRSVMLTAPVMSAMPVECPGNVGVIFAKVSGR